MLLSTRFALSHYKRLISTAKVYNIHGSFSRLPIFVPRGITQHITSGSDSFVYSSIPLLPYFWPIIFLPYSPLRITLLHHAIRLVIS